MATNIKINMEDCKIPFIKILYYHIFIQSISTHKHKILQSNITSWLEHSSQEIIFLESFIIFIFINSIYKILFLKFISLLRHLFIVTND